MRFRSLIVAFLFAASFAISSAHAAEPLKCGIIGLDAHARSWTAILNAPDAPGELADLVVTVGYPGGSPDIPQSMQLLEQGLEPIRSNGVEIVDSIDELLAKVDVVMILSIDGRTHLEQAKPVIAAGKPVFIDKPLAVSLADAQEIAKLAAAKNVPWFSSSALRYSPGTQAVLTDESVGAILGCEAFSPCKIEPHHPDMFYYGIHGVETLFTIMGTGCQSVTRVHTADADLAVGVWPDGRVGTFRGTRVGPHTYGATVFGAKRIVQAGRFEGYEPLLVEIVKFFKTGKPPIDPAVTLEILAFMEAADASKRQQGRPVKLENMEARMKKPE